MGTWGIGNLDNDTAGDEIAERSSDLLRGLWNKLQQDESWEADEWMYGALFVDFEFAFALHAAKVLNVWDAPPVGEYDRVCKAWLKGWDRYIDGLAPDEDYKRDRRKTIEETFARFRKLCEKGEQARS